MKLKYKLFTFLSFIVILVLTSCNSTVSSTIYLGSQSLTYELNETLKDDFTLKGKIETEEDATLCDYYELAYSYTLPNKTDSYLENVIYKTEKDNFSSTLEFNISLNTSIFSSNSDTIYLIYHGDEFDTKNSFTYTYSEIKYTKKDNKVTLNLDF